MRKTGRLLSICLVALLLGTSIGSYDIVNAAGVDEETDVSVTEEIQGEETSASDVEEAIGENRIETVDLSDVILQDGGLFAENEDVSDWLLKSYSLSPDQETVAEAILKALQNKESGLVVNDYNINEDELKTIFQSVMNANPQLFYVYGSYSYSYSPDTGYVFQVRFNYNDAYSDVDIEEFNRKVSSIKKNMQSDWSDEQKALYLHDYLVTNCTYDTSYSNYNAYGALVEGTSVCQGYALAYLYLLKEVGIDSFMVTSRGLNHAWNEVVIDGSTYFVDCTWDDPLGMYVSFCRHDNFLRNTQGMVDQGHSTLDWVYSDGTSAYGACTDGRYDSYYWSGIETAIRPVEDLWVYVKGRWMDIYAYDYAVSEERFLAEVNEYIDESCNASYGNNYYYAIGGNIYQLSLDGTVDVIYSLTEQEAKLGNICDLKINHNILTYYIYEDPYTMEAKGNGNVTLQVRPVTVSEVKNVAIGGRAADALRINWSRNDKAQGYIIEQNINGKWSRIARIGNKNTVTYRVEGLSASTSYKFRIKAFAFDDAEQAVYSEVVEVSGKTLPSKTSGVQIGGRAADALRINWSKNNSASGYIIDQKVGTVWKRIARISGNNITTYRVEKLTPFTEYDFRIQAFGFDGSAALYGSYSYVSGKTNPKVMSNVVIGGRAADALRVNWGKNDTASGYIIEQNLNGVWSRVARIANKDTTTFRIETLTPSTIYNFRIRAFNFDGDTPVYGGFASVSGKTNPSKMIGVVIGGKTKDALRINWTKNSSAAGYIIEQNVNGKWVRIARISNPATVTYRVAGLKSQTSYTFRVQAFNFDGVVPLYGVYTQIAGKTN